MSIELPNEWQPEFGDFPGFVKTKAQSLAEERYSEEDFKRIVLNKDDDPQAFQEMKAFFNSLWSNRDALIEAHTAQQIEENNPEPISVIFTDLPAS